MTADSSWITEHIVHETLELQVLHNFKGHCRGVSFLLHLVVFNLQSDPVWGYSCSLLFLYNCSDVLTFVHLAPQTMFRKISPLNCNTIMHSVIFRDNIYTKSSTPLLSVLQQVLSLATIAITTTTCLFLSMMMVLLLLEESGLILELLPVQVQLYFISLTNCCNNFSQDSIGSVELIKCAWLIDQGQMVQCLMVKLQKTQELHLKPYRSC